jgi:dsRNA-specific ribonuclease
MRFGLIGDQVFGLAVTDLIQQLYPNLRVGPASVSRCVVVPLSLGQVSHGDYAEIKGLY